MKILQVLLFLGAAVAAATFTGAGALAAEASWYLYPPPPPPPASVAVYGAPSAATAARVSDKQTALFCENPRGYFPQIATCYGRWMQVDVTPARRPPPR